MQLITRSIRRRLIANGRIQSCRLKTGQGKLDVKPVVKLFTPDASCTWLLTELDPLYPDRAFGMCDLGLGRPELGDVSLSEIAQIRGRLGLPVERDIYFSPTKLLSEYANEAFQRGYIWA